MADTRPRSWAIEGRGVGGGATEGVVADVSAGAPGLLMEMVDEVGEAVVADAEGAADEDVAADAAPAVSLLKNGGAPRRAAMVPTVKLGCVAKEIPARLDVMLVKVLGTMPVL